MNAARRTSIKHGARLVPMFAGVCLLSAGCASAARRAPMTGPAMQSVSVVSEPAGARVFIGATMVGETPTRLLLRRKDKGVILRFEKEGYETTEARVERTLSPWVMGDVSLALLAFNPLSGLADNPLSTSQKVALAIGISAAALAVDFAGGAIFDLPRQVRVRLKPAPLPFTADRRPLAADRCTKHIAISGKR